MVTVTILFRAFFRSIWTRNGWLSDGVRSAICTRSLGSKISLLTEVAALGTLPLPQHFSQHREVPIARLT